jgi:hypothetical protein
MLAAAFSSPDKVNGGSQVGILCIVNSILIELCFIVTVCDEDVAMYEHLLAKLNMKIIIIQLKSVYK